MRGIFVILLGVVFFSCSKTGKVKAVLYNSPIAIYSMDSTQTGGDSIVWVNLDIDLDGVDDYKIEASHERTFTLPCGYMNISYRTIYSLHSDAQIVNGFNYGELISEENVLLGITEKFIFGLVQCQAYYDYGNFFIGIQLNNRFGWIHVETTAYNGIKVFGYGISCKKNKNVVAGYAE